MAPTASAVAAWVQKQSCTPARKGISIHTCKCDPLCLALHGGHHHVCRVQAVDVVWREGCPLGTLGHDCGWLLHPKLLQATVHLRQHKVPVKLEESWLATGRRKREKGTGFTFASKRAVGSWEACGHKGCTQHGQRSNFALPVRHHIPV
eukprot:1140772-Pelagomonas_calceolata.AAC.1